MNVCVYKQGAFLFEAEYIEDTIDGMVVILDGEHKRLIMDNDYDFAHDIDEEHVGVLYTNIDGHIESRLIPAGRRKDFEEHFPTIPEQNIFIQWLKEPHVNS